MAQKHGLGRGLGALIPGAELARVSVQELPLTDLELNPF